MSQEKNTAKIYAQGTRGQFIRLERGHRYELFARDDGAFNVYDKGLCTEADEKALTEFPTVAPEGEPFEVVAGKK